MADELAVDVPVTDDEEYDEEEAMRAQAMINSPKGDNDTLAYENNDDNGMTLNLAVEDDDEDYNDSTNVTPNTKARDNYDVNSPRAKKQQQWASDDKGSAGVSGLVTQVQRPDSNSSGNSGGAGVESLVTQVPRDDDTERDIQTNMNKQQSGGLCACLSCLWSCCGSEAGKADLQMQSGVNGGSGIDGSNANGYTNSSNNGPLLENKSGDGGTTTKRTDNSEDSISSTDYSHSLLPPLKPEFVGKKCLVLDLDETLVHSSFKPIPKPDFIIPVEIDRVVHHVYVLKRPYVDEFLLRCSKHYEIVIFTASLSKYADPLLDKLDIHNVIEARLFRESCVIHGTAYVKDMRRIGRKLKDSIIVDNSPPSYLFQPTNAVPIASWFDDPNDTQLLDFCPVLETTMKDIDDVRKLLDANNKSFRWLCNQAHQPLSKYTVRNDRANRQ